MADEANLLMEVPAYSGLGVLGFFRLLLTLGYCFILSIIPIIAGWVVAYRLWIHKWNWVREILWRDPPHRISDNKPRGTYLNRRQPSLTSTFPSSSSSSSSSSSGTSSSLSTPSLPSRASADVPSAAKKNQ